MVFFAPLIQESGTFSKVYPLPGFLLAGSWLPSILVLVAELALGLVEDGLPLAVLLPVSAYSHLFYSGLLLPSQWLTCSSASLLLPPGT